MVQSGDMFKKFIIILCFIVLSCIQDNGQSLHDGIQVEYTQKGTIYIKGDWFDLEKDYRNYVIDSMYTIENKYEK